MTMNRRLTISPSQFKARRLELMDHVHDSGAIETITKHGKLVARLVPLALEATTFFASLPVKIVGDIVGPSDERWESSAERARNSV